MPKLSAFIITKNEALDIGACLDSLRNLADEVVVVDSHSTDETAAICRSRGARVFMRAFDGFAAQKQFALEQTSHPWVLSIDADEQVTPPLADEIKLLIDQPRPEAGFEIRRNFYFLGRRLQYGGLGNDWVLRLFKRDLGYFRKVQVHERVDVRGAVGRLRTPLEHYSYPTLEEYVQKCNQYTTLAAQQQWAQGRRFSWTEHLRPGWELFTRCSPGSF
jgi:glycosyltransferase involved in cell wall biosynthesis